MKKANYKGGYPLTIFRTYPMLAKAFSIFVTLAFCNFMVSCSYYNVRDVTTTPDSITNQIEEFNTSKDYAIIHSGEQLWHLGKIILNEDTKTISGVVQPLNEMHLYKKARTAKRVHRYKKDEQLPLNELHFTVKTDALPNIGEEVSIPFSEIISLSINDKNSGRTAGNVFLGTIGVIAGTFLIAMALKSSCPFIYVQNGEEFVFTGELYPGVLTANQMRNDYLALPDLKSNTDEYQIMITNELKEVQYTDLVELIVAEHSDSVSVVLDKKGVPQSLGAVLAPTSVLVDGIDNTLNPSLKKDAISYAFDADPSHPSSIRHLEIAFNKPANVTQAKLLISAKNSLWLDYVFGKFNAQFGTYYQQFQKEQQAISKEKSAQWVHDQHIPLSVYLKTDQGWQLVDSIQTVGPLAFRDIVIPLPVNQLPTATVEVKLESGFMFWEVDYIGIDYTENVPITIQYVKPHQAVDHDNNDVTTLLARADQQYFVQPHIGDEVTVSYTVNAPLHQGKQSFFLKNRGYYNYIREFKGNPNFTKLKLFKEAGAFTEFSKYEYEALMNYDKPLGEVVNNY